MNKLIFGISSIPGKERKKREKQLSIKYTDNCKPNVEFQLCVKCSKNNLNEVEQVSSMFKVICDDCKKKFCDIANKKFVIGGLVKIIKSKNLTS